MNPDRCGNSGRPLTRGDRHAADTFRRRLADAGAVEHGHLDPALYAARWAAYDRGEPLGPSLPAEPPNFSALLAYDGGEPVGVWYRHDLDDPDDLRRWRATHLPAPGTGQQARAGGLTWAEAFLAGANPGMRMLLAPDPAADWPAGQPLPDDLDAYIAEQRADPQFREALDRAVERQRHRRDGNR
jgi:hypothetical protein